MRGARCLWKFYLMSALSPEVAGMVIGVSSWKNLGRHEACHLDDQDFVNVHARILLGRQVVILIFESETLHVEVDHAHMVTWIFSCHLVLEISVCLSCHHLSSVNTALGFLGEGIWLSSASS
jgi:hypothetical protein